MPVMKHTPTTSISHQDDYVSGYVTVTNHDVDNDELGIKRSTRAVYTWAQHCRAETAVDEFRELRVEHGAEGALRTVPSKYITPVDPTVEPTHIKVGKNWRAAKAGETATHQKIAPVQPKELRPEGFHFIWSFALDEVNPDDPEQSKKAFEAIAAFVEQDYSGAQVKLVAHNDADGSKHAQEHGEGGKFHVHGAMNAVIHTEMDVDGRVFKPGMRMAGALTHVDTMRERFDAFLLEHGREYGLEPQRLPAPRSAEARAARNTDKDFHDRERGIEAGTGQVSDQDKAREGVELALSNLKQSDLAGMDSNEMKLRLAEEIKNASAVELKLRTTSAGEVKLRSYVVPERKQAIGQTRLGDRYTDTGLNEQLALVAQGQWKPLEKLQIGEPKQIPELNDAELTSLQNSVTHLAEDELALQAREAQFLKQEQQWGNAKEQRAVDHAQRVSSSNANYEQYKADQQAAPAIDLQSDYDRNFEAAAARQAQQIAALAAAHEATVRSAAEEFKARTDTWNASMAEIQQARQEILDNPPATYAGLPEDELAQRVDDLVIVREELTSKKSLTWNRVGDREAMHKLHGLTDEESRFLDAKWQSLDRPQTAQEASRAVAEAQQKAKAAATVQAEAAARVAEEKPVVPTVAPVAIAPTAAAGTPTATPVKPTEPVAVEAPNVATKSSVKVEKPTVAQKPTAKPATVKPKTKPHHARSLSEDTQSKMQGRNVELIAVVHSERADGGAYIDYQLAASDPAARNAAGLHLIAEHQVRTDQTGQKRQSARTFQQLTGGQYADLRRAAGDNQTTVDGKPVYGLRGRVVAGSNAKTPYTVIPNSMEASAKPTLQPDVLEKQKASEAKVRARDTAATKGPTAFERRLAESKSKLQADKVSNFERAQSQEQSQGMERD